MDVLRLGSENMAEYVDRAKTLLGEGGVILYPTDTLYGLGADAFSDEAVAEIYAIKGRDEKKPIHAVFADLKMVARYADVNDMAHKLAEQFLPGPLTLILRKKSGIDSGIGKGIETIGIRIPRNNFCLALARAFDKPYTTTSANRAGAAPQHSTSDILAQIGEKAAMIDLVIDGGAMPERQPSTVIDVSMGELKILREGALPSSDFAGI